MLWFFAGSPNTIVFYLFIEGIRTARGRTAAQNQEKG